MRLANTIMLGALLLTGSLAQADTIVYREIFPNEGSEDVWLGSADWTAVVGNAQGYWSPGYSGIATNIGRPNDADPVNSSYSGSERGKSYAWFESGEGNTPTALMWSYEPANLTNTANMSSISWYQGTSSGAVSASAGVKVGDAWYVSTTSYSSAPMDSGSSFAGAAEQKILDVSTAQWNPLVWTSSPDELFRDVSQTVSLPGGALQAAALYFEGCSGTIRVDTFEIKSVPEPNTIFMLIVGSIGLLIWGWQRRSK